MIIHERKFYFRHEAGKCKACWNASVKEDVQVNGMAATANTKACCNYITAGTDKFGFDCIEIPGATKSNGGNRVPSKVCGHDAGLATADATTEKTLCSKYLSSSVISCSTQNSTSLAA